MGRLLAVLGVLAALGCGSDSEPGGGSGGSGGSGAGGSGGGAGAGGNGGGEPCATAETAASTGCEGAALKQLPEDSAARGPWLVGSRLMTLSDFPVEVWYPAVAPDGTCPAKVSYDIREHLPDSQKDKIPDSENPLQECECYRDLPIDEEHGPYPVIIMVHGTGGFRTLSLDLQTHWASRGFVVLAADHPGIRLQHLLGALTGEPYDATTDQAGNVKTMLAALDAPSGDLGFLAGRIDRSRVGLAGHSAGGNAISKLGAETGVRVLASLSSGKTEAGAALESSLLLSGLEDGLVAFANGVVPAFEESPTKKRLVGVAKAGHSLPTDLCVIGADKGGILQIALDNGVNIPPIFLTLGSDGCGAENLDAKVGLSIARGVTASVFEETLACSAGATTTLAATQTSFPDVVDFREEL